MNLHDLGKRKSTGKFLAPAESAGALRVFGPRIIVDQ